MYVVCVLLAGQVGLYVGLITSGVLHCAVCVMWGVHCMCVCVYLITNV